MVLDLQQKRGNGGKVGSREELAKKEEKIKPPHHCGFQIADCGIERIGNTEAMNQEQKFSPGII
jgi:hypothetical protein